jgi:hypothetical protein
MSKVLLKSYARTFGDLHVLPLWTLPGPFSAHLFPFHHSCNDFYSYFSQFVSIYKIGTYKRNNIATYPTSVRPQKWQNVHLSYLSRTISEMKLKLIKFELVFIMGMWQLLFLPLHIYHGKCS